MKKDTSNPKPLSHEGKHDFQTEKAVDIYCPKNSRVEEREFFEPKFCFLPFFVSSWLRVCFWFFFLLTLGAAQAQEAPVKMTLGQVLRLAEKNNPTLLATLSREKEAGEFTRVADAGFYPDLGLDAVDSTGFPGSSSGFGTAGLNSFPGLVASPYRQGPGAGAYAKWDLLDLSVWHQSASARYEYGASRQRTLFETERVDEQALGLYLDAVRLRGNREAWQGLVEQLSGVRDTVKRFVRNGQYSEVQDYLIEDQLSDAAMKTSDYDRQYQAALARLALYTGQSTGNLSCPAPMDLQDTQLDRLQAPSRQPARHPSRIGDQVCQ